MFVARCGGYELLAQHSRSDLASLAITSKSHRSLVASTELCPLRTHLLSWRWVMDSWDLGMKNGKRTWDVWFLDCLSHTWHSVPSMKMARASASVSLVDEGWGIAQTGQTQKSVVLDDNGTSTIFAVDEDGQSFYIVPSDGISLGETNSKQPGHRKDWCVIGKELLLWYSPENIVPARPVDFDIGKLCSNSAGNIVIFWNKQLDDIEGNVELWCAEISVERRKGGEVWGKCEWSDAVVKLYPDFSHAYTVEVLYAASVYV
ncbi:hypothetical protein HID58_041341 [Brassica napus]|uniref:F-box associated domain-containing protein n=1 Tax=Brassica napus TaxID=3708 RepID=A0ABQ8BBT2_BRANA|nr:hypothetical protein HID58_041341 [Brassica napus]